MATKRARLSEHNAGGRPTKKTAALVSALLKSILGGAPFTICCEAAGISRETFCEWRRSDPVFATQVEQAAAKGVLARLGKIEKHGGEDWKALSWMLERQHPQHFACPETQLTVTAQAGVINAGGAGGNISAVIVTVLRISRLKEHPSCRHEPGSGCGSDALAPELAGELIREGHEGVSIISESQKESRAERYKRIHAGTLALFAARNLGNVSPDPSSRIL